MSISPVVAHWLLHKRIQPVMVPAILSVEAGGTASITLQTYNTDTISVLNLPAWATFDDVTNTLTATLPDTYTIDHAYFDVILTKGTSSTTISKGLRISISPTISQYDSLKALLVKETAPIVASSTADSIAVSDPRYFVKADNSVQLCLPIFSSYRNNGKLYIADLDTGLTVNTDSVIFKDDFIHLFKHLYIGNGRNFVVFPSTSGKLRYSIWNSESGVSGAWEPDIIPLDDFLFDSQNGISLAQGTDGAVYILASTDGTSANARVREINMIDYSTVLYPIFSTVGAGIGEVAADDTHIYTADDKYDAAGKVRCIERSTQIVTELRVPVDATLKNSVTQHKNGVTYKEQLVSGGAYVHFWLYNGQITQTSDLNTIPVPDTLRWQIPVDGEDLNIASFYTDVPLKPSEWSGFIKNSVIPPSGSTTGTFWYKPVGSDIYVPIVLENVPKYPSIFKDIAAIDDNNLFIISDDYLGLNTVINDILKHYLLMDGRPSPYVIVVHKNKVYITGYFDSPLVVWDMTKPWNNQATADYDPNDLTVDYNPKYYGPIGTSVNISKSYGGCIVEIDDVIYFYYSGEKIRSGEGGGIAVRNMLTGVASNIDSFLTSACREVINVGSMVVSNSIGDTQEEPLTLHVINPATNTIDRTIVPDVNITLNHGTMCSDCTYLYLLAQDNIDSKTILFKIDVLTGVTVKSITYPFISSISGYNNQGLAKLDYCSDGFIYCIVDSDVLVRIDTTTLAFTPIKRFNNVGQIAITPNRQLYITSAYDLHKTAIPELVDGFKDLAPVNFFKEMSVFSVGGSGATVAYTYVDTLAKSVRVTSVGSVAASSIYYPSYHNTAFAFSGITRLKITLTVHSGTCRLLNLTFKNVALDYMPISGVSGVYTTGVYELISDPINVVDGTGVWWSTDGFTYPDYDYTIAAEVLVEP